MFILGLLKEQRQEEIYKERVQQVEIRVCEFENFQVSVNVCLVFSSKYSLEVVIRHFIFLFRSRKSLWAALVMKIASKSLEIKFMM